MMLDRRAFLGALGLLAAPRAVEAQPSGKVARIGSSPRAPCPTREPSVRRRVPPRAARPRWIEGQNLTVEYPVG